MHHLLFECRQWRQQRKALYQALGRARIPVPTAAEDYPEGRLFGDPRATKALLQLLATTAIGCLPGEAARAAEKAQQDNERGLEALEAAERVGDG